MTKVVNKTKEEHRSKLLGDIENMETKQSKALGQWVKNHGEFRSADGSANLTTASDGGALVPQNLVTTAMDLSARKFQLLPYVNEVSVKTGMGSMPVIDPDETAVTKDELAKDPDLNSDINSVKFHVNTYLGRLNISNEFIQDSNSNIMPLITRQLGTIMVNTQNKAIADTMAKVPAKSISNMDDLINAIESVDPRYQSDIFMDQTSYAKVREFKDHNGRYLLNENDNTILGIPVVVVPAYTGLTGIYVGDLKTAITYFDRMETSFQYNRPSVWGSGLVAAMRFDVEPNPEANALVHLTFGGDGNTTPKSSTTQSK